MDNVLNRPLFRRREARNRLNDIAGVQRFDDGGPVRPQGLPSLNRMAAYQANMGLPDQPLSEREKEAEEQGSAIRSFLGDVADFGAGSISSLGSGAYGLAADVLSPAFATLGATSIAAELERKSDIAYNMALSNLMNGFSATEGMSAADFDMEPADFDFAVARAKSDAEAGRVKPSGPRTESRAPGDRQGPMEYVSPEEVAGTKPLPKPRLRPGTPGDRQAPMDYSSPEELAAVAAAAKGPSTMEADARGRGPMIADPAAVAAGLNADDPAVREKTVAEFMKEYSDAAPKYEGMDKGLLLAQIGFAIAAGESPNAMQNIANGLLAGSDMMLKDKAAKDEFDRQIQLASMQYGFGEIAQEKALGRQFTNYVANDTVKYRGKTYKPGESVPVIHSDIINGRMPGGIVTEGTSDALIASDAVIRKSMSDALKAQKLEPAAYRAAIETLDTAASEYSSARNLMPLLEASLLRAANGEVTGLDAALTRKMNEVMNAVGLKPEASYESPEAFESALRQVSVTMVQDLLGESGKTISDADRKLIDGLIGLQQDIVSGVIKDPDILTRKVQELMRVLESKQQNALDVYSTAMEGYGGTYSPSGTPVRSIRAERTFNSEEAMGPAVQYEWDQASGRLVRKKNEG